MSVVSSELDDQEGMKMQDLSTPTAESTVTQLETEDATAGHARIGSGETTAVEEDSAPMEGGHKIEGAAGSAGGVENVEVKTEEGGADDGTIVSGVKAVAGGVKNVLKSGIFGSGSPKSSPKPAAATGKPAAPRASLVPAKRAVPASTAGRPSMAASTSKPPIQSLAKSTSTARTAFKPTSSTSKPPLAKPPTPSSSTSKPTTSATSTPKVASSTPASPRKPTPSSTGTVRAQPTSTARASTTTTTSAPNRVRTSMLPPPRPSVGGVSKPEPLRASTTTRSATKAPGASPSTAATGAVKPRASIVSAGGGRASSALTSSTGRVGVGRVGGASNAGKAVADTTSSKEVGDLRARVEDLERQLQEEQQKKDSTSIPNEAETAIEDKQAEPSVPRAEYDALQARHDALLAAQQQIDQDSAGQVEATRDLKNQIERSEARLQEIEEARSIEAEEHARIQTAYTELQNSQSTLADCSAKDRTTLDDTLKKLQDAEKELSKVKEDLNLQKADIEAQRSVHAEEARELDTLRRASTQHEEERSKLLRQLEDAESASHGKDITKDALIAVQAEYGDLQSKHEDLVAASSQHAKDLEQAQKEKDAAHAQFVDLEAESEAQKQAISALQTAKEDIESEHAALTAKVSDKDKSLSDIQKELESAKAELASLGGTSDEKDQELKGIKAAHDELSSQHAEHIARLKQAEAELDAARQEVQRAEAEHDRSNKEREDRVAGQDEEIERLRRELEDAKVGYGEKNATQLEELKQSLTAEHAKTLQSLRDDIHHTTTQLHTAHAAEIDSLNANHATSILELNAAHVTAVGDLQLKVQNLEDALEAGKAEIAAGKSINEEMERVKGELSRTELELESVRKEVHRVEEEVETLRGDTNKVKVEFEDLNKQFASAQVEVEHLREKLKEAELQGGEKRVGEDAEVKGLKKQVEDLKDELDGTKAVLEMNKSHFETTLAELQAQRQQQQQPSDDASREEAAVGKARHEEELDVLRSRIKRLELDLKDERLQRESVVHNAQTPPFSPGSGSSGIEGSPSITKLHEAHNAKVAELEFKIKRMTGELSGHRETGEGVKVLDGNGEKAGPQEVQLQEGIENEDDTF